MATTTPFTVGAIMLADKTVGATVAAGQYLVVISTSHPPAAIEASALVLGTKPEGDLVAAHFSAGGTIASALGPTKLAIDAATQVDNVKRKDVQKFGPD